MVPVFIGCSNFGCSWTGRRVHICACSSVDIPCLVSGADIMLCLSTLLFIRILKLVLIIWGRKNIMRIVTATLTTTRVNKNAIRDKRTNKPPSVLNTPVNESFVARVAQRPSWGLFQRRVGRGAERIFFFSKEKIKGGQGHGNVDVVDRVLFLFYMLKRAWAVIHV